MGKLTDLLSINVLTYVARFLSHTHTHRGLLEKLPGNNHVPYKVIILKGAVLGNMPEPSGDFPVEKHFGIIDGRLSFSSSSDIQLKVVETLTEDDQK